MLAAINTVPVGTDSTFRHRYLIRKSTYEKEVLVANSDQILSTGCTLYSCFEIHDLVCKLSMSHSYPTTFSVFEYLR